MSARFIDQRFELIHPIGEGGCASVWLGRHRDTGALLAVKLVHPGGDEQAIGDRFRREAEIAARLSHRNLVRVFDYVHESDGQSALVMEHLRGETLEQLLARLGPLSTEAALAIAVPILRGLDHAHARDVIHRDLKPANIFLSVEPDGVVIPKVLDFGIAKATDEGAILLTQDGHILGTPAYMSPEQVRGETLSAASDVFSVGALLYEMITGQLAFRAPSAHAAMVAIMQRTVEPHPAIPEALWPVLERALCKRAEDRFASAAALREALEAAAEYTEERGGAQLQALQPVVAPLPELPPRVPSLPTRVSSPSIAPMAFSKSRRKSHSAIATTVPALEALPALPVGFSPSRRFFAAAGASVLVFAAALLTARGQAPPSISMRAVLTTNTASAAPRAAQEAAAAVQTATAPAPVASEQPSAAQPVEPIEAPPRSAQERRRGGKTNLRQVARSPGF